VTAVTNRVWVTHSSGRYPVDVAPGLLETLPAFLEEVAPGRRPVVITDRTVARVVSQPLKAPVLVVPAGESTKSRTRWAGLTDRLLDLGYGRDGIVVALGGGVIGDLAGFVAATFQRGIPCIQVPTSLLAMVDASVGGKTGVNTRHGKNLVGAFHPPAGVLADPAVARTLRQSQLRAGLVEATKHGLVADADYFQWIDTHAEELHGRDPTALATLVTRSVALKAGIVAQDERELGIRAVLNAGHTVGHALEAATGFRLTHGDAVALGLVVESVLSAALGLAPGELPDLVRGQLKRLGVPLRFPPGVDDETLVGAMRYDKKRAGATLHFALPRAPGRLVAEAGEWAVPVEPSSVRQALGEARGQLAD